MSNNSQMPRFISLRSMYRLRPDLIKREKKKRMGWGEGSGNTNCPSMRTWIQLIRTHSEHQTQKFTTITSVR